MMAKWLTWKNAATVIGWLFFVWLASGPFDDLLILVGVVWIIILLIKIGMWLVPEWRSRPYASLKRMWIFPAIFLIMWPFYAYRENAAREEGNRLVQQAEQYRQAHGVYPPNHQRQGMADYSPPQTPADRPFIMYRSPNRMFYVCSYDFDDKSWSCSGD